MLEKVLLELDTKTLLLSQRVCKIFKETIDGSMYLQEALFFRQAPTSRAGRYGDGGVNPLLTWPWQRDMGLEPIYDFLAEPDQFSAYLDHKPCENMVHLGSWRRMCFIHGVPSDKNELDTEIVKFYENGAIRNEGYDMDSEGCVRLVEEVWSWSGSISCLGSSFGRELRDALSRDERDVDWEGFMSGWHSPEIVSGDGSLTLAK
ncbi:hypothetical protein MRB53_041104 [Persea americana]|nr:hypothetical protein MRB53_041104 [Persea americana]